MQRAQRTCYVIAAIFATWVLAGSATAQDQQPQPSQQQQPPQQQPSQQQPQEQPSQQQGQAMEVMAEKESATATVDKVDAKKRKLTLKDEQGNQFKVNVPQDVKNLEAIKKGDKIEVDYYSSTALALKKGEKGKAPSAEETTMAERTPGKLPGGMVARKVAATVEVVKVDTTENKLTLKGPGGEVDTIHVTDPAMQAQLANLKKGDKIRASYTEAIAISVIPQQKQQKEG